VRLLVLGGAGGIGRALVAASLGAGDEVHVLDLPASLAAHPPPVPATPTDARDAASLAEAVAAGADALGGIDGFVNLVGFMSPPAPVAAVPVATWEEVLGGNLGAAFHAARAVAPLMTAGAMVHVGSGLGHNVRPGFGPYAVAKAGMAALVRQLALELAPALRVNCVAPSAVDTAFLRGGTGRSGEDGHPPVDLAAYAAAIPLGRVAVPADVVGPIRFLLSDAARYVTGQVLHVNGGAYMP
jgi:3-oxoacyl-[acyl-carrier protein] reductase